MTVFLMGKYFDAEGWGDLLWLGAIVSFSFLVYMRVPQSVFLKA